MNKKIAFFAFFIGVFGLFFSVYRWDSLPEDALQYFFIAYDCFGSVNLKLFLIDDYMHYIGDSGTSYNLFSITFYGLFVVAGLVYLLSKGKEINLLRFLFSVLFLSKVLHFLYSLFHSLFLANYLKITAMNYLHLFLHYFFLFLWIYFVYRVLIYFNQQRPIVLIAQKNEQIRPVEPENVKLSARELLEREDFSKPKKPLAFVTTSRSKRFLHLCIDVVLTILIFSFIINQLATFNSDSDSAMKMRGLFNSELAFYILFFCWRFFYYFIFETLFQTTPGKMLTESRVIDVDSKANTKGQMAVRTISRFIPFEAFTFFGTKGFHDSFSNTAVVPEKKVSAMGKISIIVLVVLFFIILYLMIADKF